MSVIYRILALKAQSSCGQIRGVTTKMFQNA